MHVSKNGTFYSIYVKNDYFYQKIEELNNPPTSDSLDYSLDEYMNKVQASIPELKDVSIGDVTIHVLPESSADKSSGATQDVADDIIGVTSARYSFEADQVGVSKWLNTKMDVQQDKASLRTLLSKIKNIYEKDEELGATVDKCSNDPSSIEVKTKKVTMEDGLEGESLVFNSNFDYEIADLNSELKYGKSITQILDWKFSIDGISAKEALKKMIEDMKKSNEDSLLKIGSPATRLSSILQSLQEEKQKTNK